MFKQFLVRTVALWNDEMRMLHLAIWLLTPTGALVLFSFGLFFVAMSRHPVLVIAWASVGLLCLARAGILRLKKKF